MEYSGVGDTVSWLEAGLASFLRRITKPAAADNSNMMRNRRIRIIGFTVFAGFPSVFSTSVCSFSSSFIPSWFLLSSFS